MNFSAVILAGGKSSRMGRDKAWLEMDGQPLLARQIGLVRELGAAEVFISGRADTDYGSFGCRVLLDKFNGAGPLAGIERGIEAATSPLLLVLAVDLPNLDLKLLQLLSAHCKNDVGAIPCVAGQIEPLAAFYPKSAHGLAITLLNENSYAVKNFAAGCVQSGLAVFAGFQNSREGFFKNCNTPAEFMLPEGDSLLY
jgi:molybdopterin-guanine dinucleotide biosynthesis protein A